MKKEHLGAENYTIKVTGLPQHENAYELCGDLIHHFENVLNKNTSFKSLIRILKKLMGKLKLLM